MAIGPPLVLGSAALMFVVGLRACVPNMTGEGENWSNGSMVSRAMAGAFGLAVWFSVNQMLPSGPAVMPVGCTFGEKALAVGTLKDVKVPAVVTRTTALLPWSMNHMLLSGPAVMALGLGFGPGALSRGSSPPVAGLTLPMTLPGPFSCVNQTLPSGPIVMPARLGRPVEIWWTRPPLVSIVMHFCA